VTIFKAQSSCGFAIAAHYPVCDSFVMPPSAIHPQLGGLRVLIADDDRDICHGLQQWMAVTFSDSPDQLDGS